MSDLQGIDLSRRFYGDLVRPWLHQAFPELRHASALLGYGSELLGFDDAMSQDHDWGPRVSLYLTEANFVLHADSVVAAFTDFAPKTFQEVPTGQRRQSPSLSDKSGVCRDVRHGLEVWTLRAVLGSTLALNPGEPGDNLTWLALSEQRLLEMTAGAVFHDDDGALTALRARLAYYPNDVWLYKLACQWSRIAQEQAFVGRAGCAGDDTGSRVIAARLVRDVMRLAFLVERRYAPYSKWLGTAFARLACAGELSPLLMRTLAATEWRSRDRALAEAYEVIGGFQRALKGFGELEPRIGQYFARPFTVVNADEIAEVIRARIEDPILRALPLFGSLDQISDSSELAEMPHRSRRIAEAIYREAR